MCTGTDLLLCGPAVLYQLSYISNLLLSPPSASSRQENDRAHALSLCLLRLADEKILSYHYSEVPLHYRRLYTDATLLAVFALLLRSADSADSTSAQEEAQWLEAIRLLDMALIVAACPGPQRQSTLFTLLSYCQSLLPSPSPASSSEPPAKRPRLSPPSLLRLPTPHLSRPIPRYSPSSAPSPYLPLPSTPFIITGGALDWPATDPESWDTKEYLLSKAGGGRVVPVEVGASYTSEGWGQRVVGFEDFLGSIFGDQEEEQREVQEHGKKGREEGEEHGTKKETLYLAQHSLFTQLPSLLTDVLLPDYVYSSPPPTADGTEYQPPITEDGYIMNAWLGPGGTVSPPHTDRWWNCFGELFAELETRKRGRARRGARRRRGELRRARAFAD